MQSVTSCLLDAAGILFVVLTLAKMYEIALDLRFIAKQGSDYATALLQRGVRDGVLQIKQIQIVMQEFGFPKVGRYYPPTRFLRSLRPKILSKTLLKLFPQRVLIPSLAAIAFFSRPGSRLSSLYLGI